MKFFQGICLPWSPFLPRLPWHISRLFTMAPMTCFHAETVNMDKGNRRGSTRQQLSAHLHATEEDFLCKRVWTNYSDVNDDIELVCEIPTVKLYNVNCRRNNYRNNYNKNQIRSHRNKDLDMQTCGKYVLEPFQHHTTNIFYDC